MKEEKKSIFSIFYDHPYITLTLIAAALFFPLLGSYPLLGQWEPHYGRVAMEMMAADGWDWFLDPVYLGKARFWSKPIFCFWMVFPFYAILGPTELATRLPFAINGIIGILMVYYITYKMFNDKKRAFLTAFILIFTPFYYLITKQFMWDITMVVFIYSAIGLIYIGMRDDNKKQIRIAYVLLGGAMLAKGLLAILIPGGIFFVWMLISADYSVLQEQRGVKNLLKQYGAFFKKIRFLEGAGIFLAVSAWWYIYMTMKHGMPFLKEFFLEHHFGRIAGMIDKPDGPFEFYLWQFSVGAFPWVGMFVPALFFIGMDKKNRREEQFVVLSIFFIFLFFTLSATKFPHYIFPAIPFFAMIVAQPFISFFNGRRIHLYSLSIVVAALLIGVIAKDLGTGMNYRDFLYIITTHKVQKWFGRVYDMRPFLYVFVPPMVVFLLLPMLRVKNKLLVKTGISGFFLTTIAFAGYMNFYWVPHMLNVFTPKKLVETYKELKKPGDMIVDYHNWKNRSMYFYLGLEEKLHRVNSVASVRKLIEDNPENTVFITTKKDKIPELRASLMADLGIPVTKVADDKEDTYMEIEIYKASLTEKGKLDDSWKKNIISEKDLPRNLKNINSTLGDKSIEIIGYTINKNRFDPKETLKLTLYYKVLKKIEEDYKIFFHFDVYRGALPYSFKIDEFPLKGYYPSKKWKVGDIIRDDFEHVIPSAHPGGGIKIYSGFFKGRKRMPVDENKYNDGQERFILGTFNINIR